MDKKFVCFLIDCLLFLPGEDPGSERGDVAGRLRAVPRQDRGRDPAGIGHVIQQIGHVNQQVGHVIQQVGHVIRLIV
jgi:hypothetical protein